MNNNNENEKKENSADVKNGDAESSTKSKKTDSMNSEAKENSKIILQKAGELSTKVFAAAKAATKDLAQEIQQVNAVRKETLATAAEGTKKKTLAIAFWTKISGKQKGILLGIAAVFLYLLYVVLSPDVASTPNQSSQKGHPPKTSTSTNDRINDPYWDNVYIDQVRARNDASKRRSHIIQGIDFEIHHTLPTNAALILQLSDGTKSAYISTIGGHPIPWIVDCANKRRKNKKEDPWIDVLPNTVGGNVVAHICRLPAYQ